MYCLLDKIFVIDKHWKKAFCLLLLDFRYVYFSYVSYVYYLHFHFQLQERKKLHEFEENRYFTFLCARREACLCTLPFLHRPPCKKLGSPGLGPTLNNLRGTKKISPSLKINILPPAWNNLRRTQKTSCPTWLVTKMTSQHFSSSLPHSSLVKFSFFHCNHYGTYAPTTRHHTPFACSQLVMMMAP